MSTNRLGYTRTRCIGRDWPLWFKHHWRLHNHGIKACQYKAKLGAHKPRNGGGGRRR